MKRCKSIRSLMSKIIAVLVEGDTEVEFYKALIEKLRECQGTAFDCKFEVKNMRGVGNYKLDAGRKLDVLRKKYPDDEIHVFLCFDTDVFDFSKKPPIQVDAVKKSLLEKSAKKVTVIRAKRSIEDWFLYDMEGIARYLRLPTDTKRPKGSGQEALKALFKKKNRVYAKGLKTEGFIEHLDIVKIMKQVCCEIKPLCKCIGIDCSKVCGSR